MCTRADHHVREVAIGDFVGGQQDLPSGGHERLPNDGHLATQRACGRSRLPRPSASPTGT
jgi:hypothetical protein